MCVDGFGLVVSRAQSTHACVYTYCMLSPNRLAMQHYLYRVDRFAHITQCNPFTDKMARGHQKAQSQAKTLEKNAKAKKQQGHSAMDQKKAAMAALVHVCVICKVSVCVENGIPREIVDPCMPVIVELIYAFPFCSQSQMPDPKTYKQHFENKHPKNDMPEELKDVVA